MCIKGRGCKKNNSQGFEKLKTFIDKFELLKSLISVDDKFLSIEDKLEKRIIEFTKKYKDTEIDCFYEHDPRNQQNIRNYINARFLLAKMYHHGAGIGVNLQHAYINYLFCATHADHSESYYQLGCFYEKDIGLVPPDYQKAKQYFQLAAEKNHELAQARLSTSYNISRFFNCYSNDSIPSDAELNNRNCGCKLM